MKIKKVILAVHILFWPLALMAAYLHLWSEGYGGVFSNKSHRLMLSRGEALYESKNCAECHGPEGRETAVSSYPLLAGQNADYLELQLLNIQSQRRKTPESASMLPFLQGLRPEDLRAIALYLQAQK